MPCCGTQKLLCCVVVFVSANSAKVLAQKTKSCTKISLTLTKFGGPSSKDAMGFIVGDLFQAFRSQSVALSAGLCCCNPMDNRL